MIRRSHLSEGRAHYALKRGQHVDLRLTLPAQFQYKTLQGDHEPDCVLSFSADNARGESGDVTWRKDKWPNCGGFLPPASMCLHQPIIHLPNTSIRKRGTQ